jgi:hypothetical protein
MSPCGFEETAQKYGAKSTAHYEMDLARADLYRVNFEVNNLKPFACLAFPLSLPRKMALEWPSFGDELVTSFPLA